MAGIPVVSAHKEALCVCVPHEGASLWRVWVSVRGDLVVACLGVHARGPRCGVFGVSMRGGLVVAYLGVHTRGPCEGRL